MDSLVVQRLWERFEIQSLPEIERLDLTTVSLQELEQISYLNRADARKIIAHRTKNKGISTATLSELFVNSPNKLQRIKLYLYQKLFMIDFELRPEIQSSETQRMVYEAARDFATQFIKPNVMDWDEAQYFPAEIFEQAGALGFMGMLIPEAYGGSGMGYHEYVTLIETISIVDPSIGLSIAAHNSFVSIIFIPLERRSNAKNGFPSFVREALLAPGDLPNTIPVRMPKACPLQLSKEGDQWVLNGTKNFITHGISGDIAVVIARNGEKGANRGMTAFVVERGTPGFYAGKKENKLGMRASETAEMVFDECVIPDANRLGPVGDGFIQSMKILDGGRISIAALSLG